ncbi:hypothetical protein [Paracraurococcus lichenis]|uniref:Uncharacterized protein n=1 Tax=Paracraurococcus lichenis TaxID=3064888 RepID=A0ABT9ECH6_9PROT|nr:hypothetical protein [Paracraurococcus sp. LOR1-02]MDO9713913.1 hypothetical protein [Paracraurococcus sp. LOR1-02]
MAAGSGEGADFGERQGGGLAPGGAGLAGEAGGGIGDQRVAQVDGVAVAAAEPGDGLQPAADGADPGAAVAEIGDEGGERGWAGGEAAAAAEVPPVAAVRGRAPSERLLDAGCGRAACEEGRHHAKAQSPTPTVR